MKKAISSIVIFAIMFSAPAFAATRFYLPSSGTSDLTTAAYGPGWTDTTSAAPGQLRCSKWKTNTGSVTKVSATNTLGRFLLNQYISDPIAAQTISGNVSGEIAGIVTHTTGVTAYTSIIIKVVSSEGVTRGTLLSITRGNTVIPPTTAAGRWTPPVPTTLSSVTAQNGDRIVIEVGVSVEATSGSRHADLTFLDNGTGDLTEGGANTLNPWVEFSQDIIFPSVTVID